MPNVDTVYQRVLALANKEQRGYITPQEFNLLANKAQLIIFEQYFYRIDGLASKRIAEHILNNTTHKVNQYKNPEIIFNNLKKLNELVKHKIAVNRWKKTKKYFGISEIQDSIKKTTNPNVNVDMTSYINNIQLASIKITKKFDI